MFNKTLFGDTGSVELRTTHKKLKARQLSNASVVCVFGSGELKVFLTCRWQCAGLGVAGARLYSARRTAVH